MAETRRLRGLIGPAVERVRDMPEGPVAVALSGGADSAACAVVVQRAGRDVRALHVHHGLPGSDGMARAATSVAAALGMHLDVLGISPPPGPSFEGRARQLRYEAMIAALGPAEILATGHTLDDQAETVLMNLVRGSGLDGLAGIPDAREGVIRPLLGTTRAQTRELATLAGLPWRDDPANDDPAHLRNRVRREVLPSLRRSFNPGISASLARTASVAASEAAVLERLASTIPRELGPDGVRFPVGALGAVPAPIAARALRWAVRRLGREHPPASDAVERALRLGPGGQAPLGDALVARRHGPWLIVGPPPAPAGPPAPVEVVAPATVRWGTLTLELGVSDRPEVMPLSALRLVHPVHHPEPKITVRAHRADDRVGGKRVVDALAEAGIPPADRRVWPVVVLDDEVVWVPGVRRAGSPRRDADRYLCGVASEERAWRPSGR